MCRPLNGSFVSVAAFNEFIISTRPTSSTYILLPWDIAGIKGSPKFHTLQPPHPYRILWRYPWHFIYKDKGTTPADIVSQLPFVRLDKTRGGYRVFPFVSCV